MDEDEIGFFTGQFTGYDYLHKIRKVVNHLIKFADEVMNTTGVEDLLSAGEDTRWYSLKMFPSEGEEWVSEAKAMDITGRKQRTLREWKRSGTIRFMEDDRGIEYYKPDLDLKMEIVRGNMTRNAQSLNKRRWWSSM